VFQLFLEGIRNKKDFQYEGRRERERLRGKKGRGGEGGEGGRRKERKINVATEDH